MIGDVVLDNGVLFEVVWSGGELLHPRASRPSLLVEDEWEPPNRLYKPRGGVNALIQKPPLDQSTPPSVDRALFRAQLEALRDTSRATVGSEEPRADPAGSDCSTHGGGHEGT